MTAAQAGDADGSSGRSTDSMSERDAIPNSTVIIRAAGSPEIVWRTRRMISLGADAELAVDMATG